LKSKGLYLTIGEVFCYEKFQRCSSRKLSKGSYGKIFLDINEDKDLSIVVEMGLLE